MTSRLTTAQTDRAAGTLLAMAAGDALGAGYEFGPPLPDDAAVTMAGGGSFGWAPGEWTDDTSMAVAIAEVSAEALDLRTTEAQDRVAERWIEWASSAKDVGVQTRQVLTAARRGAGSVSVRLRSAATQLHRRTGRTGGNGSLMRTAPVALAYLDDPEALVDAAQAISSPTHADPEAGEACALWCLAIRHAVLEASFDGLRLALDRLPADRRGVWAARLDDAEARPPSSFSHNGWVVEALQGAWSAIVRTPVPTSSTRGDFPADHLRLALEAAVRGGRDTDTVAAIAGSLLGARWGASAVPSAWRRLLHGWPGLRGRDLVRLGVLTARGGQPDGAGWPSAAVVDYSGWPDRHVLVQHPNDSGVWLGGVGALEHLPTGADAVVSLCRLGAEQVPAAGVKPENHVEVWLIDEADPAKNPNLGFVLDDAAQSVVELRTEGKTVLLHCVQAQSRTPTVAALYGAGLTDRTPLEELTAVQTVLPDAHPNSAMIEALDGLDRSEISNEPVEGRGSTSPGHVFVVHGDIATLAVDAWVLPTDQFAHIRSRYWKVYGSDNGERRSSFSQDFQDGRLFAEVLPWPVDVPGVPVCTAVPAHGISSVDELKPRLEEGLRLAADVARRRAESGTVPRIATPTFGTDGGGGGHVVGSFLQAYLDLAGDCAATTGVDVVITCKNSASYHGLQILRCGGNDGSAWPELDEKKREQARELARKARAGELTPFMGSGISVTSGLPDWVGLLQRLRAGLPGLTDVSADQFKSLSTLDQADLLATVMRGELKQAIADQTKTAKVGLPPLLLAALPVREAVTLNYDTLFETARQSQGSPLTVIPDGRAAAGTTWLLKLHGSTDRISDIVLTRQDYLAYASSRSALSSLATAMLMTRHLLFVGFGFNDDHFHRLLHDVQAVYGSEGQSHSERRRLGTALVLGHDTVRERLWKDSLDIVPFAVDGDKSAEGRLLEIFLDMLTAHAVESPSYFLRREYADMLTDSEVRLAVDFRRAMETAAEVDVRPSVREAFDHLDRLLGSPSIAKGTDRVQPR